MELYTKKSKVIKLNENSFSEGKLLPSAIKNRRVTLVMFYVSWCGHCQQAEPMWTKFSNKAPKDISVAVVDSVKYPELSHNFGVVGYPTIKVFNKQGALLGDYVDERNLDNLLRFSSSLISPPASPSSHSSPPKPKKSKKKPDVVIVKKRKSVTKKEVKVKVKKEVKKQKKEKGEKKVKKVQKK